MKLLSEGKAPSISILQDTKNYEITTPIVAMLIWVPGILRSCKAQASIVAPVVNTSSIINRCLLTNRLVLLTKNAASILSTLSERVLRVCVWVNLFLTSALL